MRGDGRTGGRGRTRKTLQETVREYDDDYIPYIFKTPGRKRGRLSRENPKKMVNESSFRKTPRRKSRRLTKTAQKMVDEFDDDHTPSPHKELSTDGSSHPVQDSGVPFKDPLNTDLVKYVRGKERSSSHLATPIDERMNLLETEDDLCCPTKGKTVAEEPASESILQENNELSSSSHPVQDSGVPFKDPSDTDLVKYVRRKEGSSSHLAPPIDERMNLLEAEDGLCCPTKGKTVAEEEPASESILHENKVSGHEDNTAKNSVSTDSSKSECGSSIIRSKRSEDLQQSIIPMDLCEDDHLPLTQVNVVANNGKKTPCQSFNLTEAVNKNQNGLHDDDDDDDGIQSSINPALVDVKGYRVRPEIATLLHQILEQHGDIAKGCKVKALREFFFEKVCSFYEKLQKSSFQDIKTRELKAMGETLDEFEHMGLNVKWLSKKLDNILDVKVFLKAYSKKSEEIKKANDQLATLEKTAASIRQKMTVLGMEISKMKDDKEKIQKVRILLNNSHGLI